jgi:TolB-like protein
MSQKPFPAYEGEEPYFFVSYAHEDAGIVYPEMSWIDRAGFNLWYDDGIHVGTVWRQALADALSGAVGLIFFATGRSTESGNCLKELNFILDEEKPVFVVQLDDTPLPGLLRLSLSDRQALVKSDYDLETYHSRLVSALSTVVAPAVKVVSGEAPRSAAGGIKTDPPSIAVLPFACLADDRELAFLADGITGDLIARLSQRIWHIVACHPDDVTLEAQQIGERRGVRYVLGGAAQKGGDRVRVTARLTDAQSGRELWAQRYEETDGDVLELQDQIVNSIDYDLFDPVLIAEGERLRNIPDEELDAWGLCARARVPIRDRASRNRVRALLEQAVARDPDFAFAHSLFGLVLTTMIFNQFSRRPEEDAQLARRMADRALSLAPNNIVVLNQASFVHRVVGDPDHALHLAERAAQIGGRPWAPLPQALITVGRFEDALALASTTIGDNLSPGTMAVASLAAGKLQDALDWARRATTTTPQEFLNWAYLACAQARLGQTDEARASIARAKEIVPTFTLDLYEKGIRIGWRNREDIVEAMMGGLRELGLD